MAYRIKKQGLNPIIIESANRLEGRDISQTTGSRSFVYHSLSVEQGEKCFATSYVECPPSILTFNKREF